MGRPAHPNGRPPVLLWCCSGSRGAKVPQRRALEPQPFIESLRTGPVLSGSELDPCATAAGGDTDAALEEHLPDSLTPMRRSYNNGSDPKESRAVREVRRHVRA